MTTMTASTSAPLVAALDEDAAQWFVGARTWIRTTAAHAGGVQGVIEFILPAGWGTPYHVHRNEDETFYVIDGEIRVFSGDQSWVAGPGGIAFLPCNIPHGFRVEGSAPVRALHLATSIGFEGFVTDLSEPAPPAGPPDFPKLALVAARYGIEILGPLPE
ncbi:MAG: cupin domain-containing protein [Thermomicrobiales bacterium]